MLDSVAHVALARELQESQRTRVQIEQFSKRFGTAGEIVLGGSFTRPVACTAGDTFHADYGPLGSISVRFV